MRFSKVFLTGTVIVIILLISIIIMNTGIGNNDVADSYKIIFLHHSTGEVIKNGEVKPIRYVGKFIRQKSSVSKWFDEYNKLNETNYIFEDQFFPKKKVYGWNNYPYDYYNIWVKNAGEKPYLDEPTLEILTKQYDMIIFKHCFPVCDIEENINQPDINSSKKRLENYKLQYQALKKKMYEFPDTKFLLWTGAARVENSLPKERALRAKEFFNWVRTEWNTPGDNIFIWDFYELETKGSLYLNPEFAKSTTDSHPNQSFAKNTFILFCERIVEVINLKN